MTRAKPVPWPLRDRWVSAGEFHVTAKRQPQALCLLAAAMLCWLVAAPSWAAENPSGPSEESEEQQPKNNTGQASLDYSATSSSSGCAMFGNIQVCTDKYYTQQFSGSVTLKRTEEDDEYEGFHGEGTASYSFTGGTDTKPHDGCPAGEGDHTEVTGTVTLTVNAACALNGMTSGPDTSMYDYYTTNVEGVIEAYDLHLESKWHHCNGHRDSMSHDEAGAGTGCYFYNVDFDNGGTYKYVGEEARDTPFVCTMAITLPPGPKLRVYGTVKGQGGNRADRKGPFPIPNARVVAMPFDGPRLQKLSELRPAFTRKAVTSDDEEAKYELELSYCEKPSKIVVVSVLWYDGKPEFAVTNGPQPTAGKRGIPIYLAACVDDDPSSKCYKWKKVDDGYEAEVDFEFGNDDQIDRQNLFMDSEDWQGRGTTREIMRDSAYIYYNSYRGVKYFDSLALGYPTNPVMIHGHYVEEDCADDPEGAWYKTTSLLFGDLGRYLDRVSGKGGVFICSGSSEVDQVDAPVNREWHELGHYLLYQMYSPNKSCPNCKDHGGFKNDNTSWSYIEGFAEFTAALTNKHFGSAAAHLYPVADAVLNLELDFKAWTAIEAGVDENGVMQFYTEEEWAVAGVLWDLFDPGREIALRHMVNGTLVELSKVYPNPVDQVSLDEKLILQVIRKGKPQTVVDLFNAFTGTYVSRVDEDMIFLEHGFFADILDRNYIHDSVAETIPESGHPPRRMRRQSPPPNLPGSFIVADADATFEVSITFLQGDGQHDYSYRLLMQSGVPAYFTMPPEYYASKAVISPVTDGKKGPAILEIDSDEYWDYIRLGPEKSAVFKRIPGGDTD